MEIDEIPVNRARDLRGKKFGKFTVLYRVKPPFNSKNKSAFWKVQCECGNISILRSDCLLNNITTDCGCSKNIKKHDRIKVGDIFGYLKVIEETKKRGVGGNKIYKVECLKCGNIIETRGTRLISGETISCGCINSKGEDLIIKLLKQNNKNYIYHYKNENCRFPDTQHMAEFDFFVENSYIIEFDGEQHYYGWGRDELNYQEIKNRDEYKNQWCKDNNIPLIRIPYTKFDTLSIEDLMLETTKFRII